MLDSVTSAQRQPVKPQLDRRRARHLDEDRKSPTRQVPGLSLSGQVGSYRAETDWPLPPRTKLSMSSKDRRSCPFDRRPYCSDAWSGTAEAAELLISARGDAAGTALPDRD